MKSDESFSDQLERWLRGDASKTLGTLSDVFAEKSFAVMILLMMFVPAIPLPTGAITYLFEVITLVLTTQMVLGRRVLWLPDRWRHHELGTMTTGKAIPFVVRRVRWFERHSRPRWARLFEQRWFLRLLGLVLTAFALAAIIAPPFSGLDTFPAVGAVLVALAIVLEDFLILLIGIAIGTGGVVLILTIGVALVRVVRHLV